MVRCCAVLILVPLAIAAAQIPAAPAAQPPAQPPAIRLGVLSGMFRDVPPELIVAASSPFRDLFKRETGLNSEVEVIEDYETLAARMKQKQLHFGVFHGYELAWVRDRYPELQALAISIPNGRKVQACLVVNATSKAQTPGDLKGACITIPIGTKAHCHLYLDWLKDGLPEGCCCPAGMRELGPEEALDGVALNKYTAALVDVGSLTAYQNNKPGAFTALKVLDRSEPFPSAAVVFRKDTLDATVLTKVRNGLVKANENPQGKAFMMLWRLKGFEDPSPEYEADLKRIVKAYPAPRSM